MTRALVLSGGGSVGIAWQTGLACGLRRKGVDLGDAECIVGTSAGSAVGAQLALGRDLEEQVGRYARAEPRSDNPPPTTTTAERMATFMALMIETAELEPDERRSRIGRFALEADALAEEEFVGMFGYLRGEPWPERYRCTAVDAESGGFQVWDPSAGIELDRAVASSCAVPGLFSPITINVRRYLDGGMRSGTYAVLGGGHDVVLVVSLMTAKRLPAGDPRLARVLQTMEHESRILTEAGARVEVVGPDAAAASAMGMNLMDASLGPKAAMEGLRQGELIADQIRAYWAN